MSTLFVVLANGTFVTRALLVVGVDSLGVPVCLHLLLYVLFIDLLVFNLFVVGLVTLKGAVMVPYTALSSPRRSPSSALVPSSSDRKVGLYLAGCFPGHHGAEELPVLLWFACFSVD